TITKLNIDQNPATALPISVPTSPKKPAPLTCSISTADSSFMIETPFSVSPLLQAISLLQIRSFFQ
ncbi:hypothetical protein ACJ8PF_24585, partial [Serratia sp. CY81166]|uniref:hypothetical protein n=1 Tax=Serratia sp. CY81166 TaxID=3383683 RepID=UPI003F9F7D6B